jgi:muramoyltetrapeptide carboxypeptidase LdcA involved in peptidoglycan recycling
MRYPEFLKEQGTIGCIAPSFGCNIEPYHSAFRHALDVWQEMGYQVKLGPNCYEGSGIGISNTPERCGEEVNRFLTGSESDVVVSCGGGELMCEVVSHIDFEAIAKAKPKWFMGFSDNTNLTFLLTTLCDTAAIYGPCAPSFGMEPWHPVLQDAWGVLTGKKDVVKGYPLWEKESLKDETHPFEPYHVTEPKRLVVYDGGGQTQEKITIKGRLLGGCLDCLDTLVGTRFDKVESFCERYREDGILWFIESCDLNPMGIRRALWQLKEAGWFRYVSGFLIGRPLCFGEEFLGLDQYRAVVDVLQEYHVPIIMDADLGHLPPSMPIVCGANATVTVAEEDGRPELTVAYQLPKIIKN